MVGREGQNYPYDEKFSEKCPCLHYNNTALIKQIPLFDTALVITKTKVIIQSKENLTFD